MLNFTHKFTLIPLHSIKSQWKQIVNLEDGAQVATFMASDPVSFEQSTVVDDAGVHTSASFSAVVKDKNILRVNGCRAILELTLSDGSLRYIGTKDDAPIFWVTPHLDRYLIEMATTLSEPLEL